MRSEKEMMDLILSIAQADDRIRAVVLNGSRVNPNVKPDRFQDYDIVYLVTEVAPFCNNLEWIKLFGEIMILQMPETFQEPPIQDFSFFGYLMQFLDGNRIDLTIYPISKLQDRQRDSLSILLLDKDGIVEPFPPPNESDYLPTPPSLLQFNNCCNEFWWVSTYVAKGLARNEILYAKSMLEQVIRPELMRMLTWYIGINTGFQVNPGKFGKHFQNYLEPMLWDQLLSTYSTANTESIWQAHFKMAELFRSAAVQVAQSLAYEYNITEDDNVMGYLRSIHNLSK